MLGQRNTVTEAVCGQPGHDRAGPGRRANALDWDAKLALDVWYVDHRSLGLDARILARTLVKVARREGISQPGHATAEPFRGSRPAD